MLLKTIICFVCFILSLTADPWGKDADLVTKPLFSLPTPSPSSPLVAFGEKAIKFHQTVISPIDGPRSHFKPSSSQYTLDAMHKYGFFRGFIMGCDRLMRENNDPWVYRKIQVPGNGEMKWDPVR
jgi:putative component of membrane protein insertase Oxa1/YidC/SpoIIIJ protein YidD